MSDRGDEALVRMGGRKGQDVSGESGAITDTSAATVIAAPGSGKRTGITAIMVTNASTSTAAVVSIRSASTVIWRGYAKAEGGWAIDFTKPLMCAENEAVTAISSASVASGIYVSVNGVTLGIDE